MSEPSPQQAGPVPGPQPYPPYPPYSSPINMYAILSPVFAVMVFPPLDTVGRALLRGEP